MTSVFNIALGASIINVGLADASLSLVAIALLTSTGFDFLTLLFVILAFRQVGFALIMKPVAGQPFDSHLYYPTLTLLVTFFGLAAALMGIRIADRFLRFLPKVSMPVRDRTYLTMATICAVLGVIGILDQAWLVNRIANRNIANIDSAGLASILPAFIILSTVLTAARATRLRGSRWLTDPFLLALMATQCVHGLLTNGRSDILLAFITPTVTAFAFGFRPRATTVAIAAVGSLGLFVLISPVILSLRSNVGSQTASDRISTAVDQFQSIVTFHGGPLLIQGGTPFYDYFGVIPDPVRERFAMLKHTDVVVAGVTSVGHLSAQPLVQSVINVLPRVIGAEKQTRWSIGNRIYCVLGWRVECITDPNSTMPVIAESYAVVEWWQSPLITLVAFLLATIPMGLGGTIMRGNVWAVFCFIQFGNTLTEGDTGGLALVARTCLLFAICVPILTMASARLVGESVALSR